MYKTLSTSYAHVTHFNDAQRNSPDISTTCNSYHQSGDGNEDLVSDAP